MRSIRRTKTASGATAIQVVRYVNGMTKIEKHVGSGNSKEDISILYQKAEKWIESKTKQQNLFTPETPIELSQSNLELVKVVHAFAYNLMERVALKCGLSMKKDRFLFDFALMRMIEPASKLRTIMLLQRYFTISYSKRTVYRKIKTLIEDKKRIEELAIQCAKKMLQADIAIVLYDVTTLYFETFKGDELRKEGFSKDNKPQQPQIVLGLLVNSQGFPLGYEIFPGNTFEGKTMLIVLKEFISKHNVQKPVVVADAAMLSQTNIEELQKDGFSYIVGARLANTTNVIFNEVCKNFGESHKNTAIRINSPTGDLIVEFSEKRYRKDKHEFNKQLERAKQNVESKRGGKNARFVRYKTNRVDTELNDALIAKAKALLGLKGYYTNVPIKVLTDTEIIARYHDLWHVEHTFRIAKSDLSSRPIFHYAEKAVRSHVLICFTALMLTKYVEIKTQISLKQIINEIWEIKDVHLYNTLTEANFSIRSKISPEASSIVKKIDPHYTY